MRAEKLLLLSSIVILWIGKKSHILIQQTLEYRCNNRTHVVGEWEGVMMIMMSEVGDEQRR